MQAVPEQCAHLQGVLSMAEQLLAGDPTLVFTKQFENAANPAVHFLTTGPEIWAQTQGRVDVFLAGVGTGGTVTGEQPGSCVWVISTVSSCVQLMFFALQAWGSSSSQRSRE